MKRFYMLKMTGIVLQVIGWIITIVALALVAASWPDHVSNFIPGTPPKQLTMAECISSTMFVQLSALYLIAGLGALALGQIAGAVVHLATRPSV